VVGYFAELCDLQGRKSHERRVEVHFDNELIHNPEGIKEFLANVGFRRRRMEHPPYSLD
jgi:hypothetical protein